MENVKNKGMIHTFYSFKGGVGRTMALANVGFLAAMNGLKVLVMDWDLEAPGLIYYFRGIIERSPQIAFDQRPGVLNFLSDWEELLISDISSEDFNKKKQTYIDGTVFSNAASSLIDPVLQSQILSPGACLHYIGAGSAFINESSYEDTLSKFSWSDFLEKRAGGFLLSHLKDWAKSNYDLILIDSRTGLVDVAGICTMSLPDSVALCFVLNQQNIDGIAKVAAAINTNGEGKIGIRTVPMRVDRRGSAEASEAQARAIKALSKKGTLSKSRVEFDMQSIFIKIEENVPFYETLAPFTTSDPSLDPLTLGYVRLAKELIGVDINPPIFKAGFLNIIKERLMPSEATVQYVIDLGTAEPDRAFTELKKLVEAISDSDIEKDDLDEDYISILLEVIVGLVNRSEDPEEAFSLQTTLLEILRRLNKKNKRWNPLLISAIENSMGLTSLYGRNADEASLLKELDSLLAEDGSFASLLQRLNYNRQLARIFMSVGQSEDVISTIVNMNLIAHDAAEKFNNLSDYEYQMIAVALADTKQLRGEVFESTGSTEDALLSYEEGLKYISDYSIANSAEEIRDMRFALHFKIASLKVKDGNYVIYHALEAVKTLSSEVVRNFVSLTEIITSNSSSTEEVMVFCRYIFLEMDDRKRNRFFGFFGRAPSRAISFLSAMTDLLKRVIDDPTDRSKDVLEEMVETVSQTARNIRTVRRFFNQEALQDLVVNFLGFARVLDDLGLEKSLINPLIDSVNLLRNEMVILGTSVERK